MIKNAKVVYPQEIEVWYVLPAIRREFALEMKRRGIGQKKIADTLGLTEAAVSPYISKKRALKIKFGDDFSKEISSAVDEILKDKQNLLIEVDRLIHMKSIRNEICNLHKKQGGVSKECSICKS